METARWRWMGLGTLAVYVALVIAGSLIRKEVGAGPSPAMWGVAAGTIGAALGAMALVITAGRRSRELERLIFSEGTSIAFFVTMLGALTYGLLEAWLEAPRLTAWATWSLGMGSWAVLSIVLKRRMS